MGIMGEVIGKNSTAVEHGAQAWASPITPTYTRAHTWTACRHDTHTCCKDVHTHTHTSLRTQAVTNAEYFILFYFLASGIVLNYHNSTAFKEKSTMKLN